jgi:hypothetical protein
MSYYLLFASKATTRQEYKSSKILNMFRITSVALQNVKYKKHSTQKTIWLLCFRSIYVKFALFFSCFKSLGDVTTRHTHIVRRISIYSTLNEVLEGRETYHRYFLEGRILYAESENKTFITANFR